MKPSAVYLIVGLAIGMVMTASRLQAQVPMPEGPPAAVAPGPAGPPEMVAPAEPELPPNFDPGQEPDQPPPGVEKPSADLPQVWVPKPQAMNTPPPPDDAFDTSEDATGFLSLGPPLDAAEPGMDAVDVAGSDLISITLDDVEIVDVVRMFTRISGANIIATPSNLQGRVTVNLADVEWRPALESILDMHGLAITEKMPGSKIFSIVPRAPGAPEPMTVETYFLKFAAVGDVQPVATSMLVSGGEVSPFPSKNALVIRSTAANQREIAALIEKIDIPRDQVFIEAKFMELTDEAIKDIGINWQSLAGFQLSASSMSRALDDSRSWSDTRTDQQFGYNYDIGGDAKWGVFNAYGQQVPGGQPQAPTAGQYPPALTVPDSTGQSVLQSAVLGLEKNAEIIRGFDRQVSDARSAVLGASDFQIILSALRQMNGVTVVSNPKIIVANEEPARIHIGLTERPFVSSITPGQQGIAPVVTYNPGEPVDTGVKLTVTPTVNTESNITVRIEPELTRFVRDAVAPNGQTYPIIAKKTIETLFALDSGKTVAIGGLTETSDRDVTSKVPLLGDIPLIGRYLFSHTHREKQQTETIIFVTVGLATPAQMLKDSGVPEDTRLTHRHLLAAEAERRAFDAEMKALMEQNELERRREAIDDKAELLKRRN